MSYIYWFECSYLVPNDEVSARRDIDDPDLLETLEQCYALVRDGSRPNTDTLLSRYMKRPMFDNLKLRITRMDHNLLDIIWPVTKKLPEDVIDEDLKEIIEENGGVVIPDYETYFVFADLLQPIIKDLHGLIVTYELNTQPGTMFFEPADKYGENRSQCSADDVRRVKVDPISRWVVSGHVECTRNLKLFQLPACMSLSQLETMERDLLNILDPEVDVRNAISSNQQGTYYRLDEIMSDGSGLRSKLDSEDLSIPLSDANYEGLLHGAHWPHGRGVYIYNGYTMAVWINVQDHIRILSRVDSTGDVGQAYERISKSVTSLNEHFRFKRDPYLGFLTSRPSALGNTLRFYITLYLPKLGNEEGKLKQLCSVRYLNVRKVRDRDDSFRIYNKQNLSINELQTFREFTAAVSNILQLEKNLTTNSQPQNTSGGLFNIFKKK
ncbi:hypothetical protein PR048_000241 [Dryococelus australis]|uniref:arginine kinase n=1 Tax=Dryococelus australis TaxID=614101 RepID=A0ABQ9IE26_9NEOP|nr:hypothetical protein PR048_000241 [Dryococelus australis]